MKRQTVSLALIVAFLFCAAGISHARYYDPESGRFISRDPIGYEGGVNLQEYAIGNPLRYTDPSGLEIVIEGEPDLVKKAEAIIQALKKDSDAEVKKRVEEMEKDKKSCKIKLVFKSKSVVVGSYQSGEVDMGDIEAFPTSGAPLRQDAAFAHELFEQWEKQINKKPYKQAHSEALVWESKVSGWARTGQSIPKGGSVKVNPGETVIDLAHEKKTEITKDGKKETVIEKKTGRITIKHSGEITIKNLP